MTELTTFLLTLMLALQPHYLDTETKEERKERLTVIAQSIEIASARATCSGKYDKENCKKIFNGRQIQLANLLLTTAYWESRLAENVHKGNCKEWQCDPFKNPRTGQIEHRARTIWQMQRTPLIDNQWDKMVGTDYEATREAAWAASKILSRGYNSCNNALGAFSRYAGLGKCKVDQYGKKLRDNFKKRVNFYKMLMLKYHEVTNNTQSD